MNELKPGKKTTEFMALILGVLATLLPVILKAVPDDSIWAVILGSVLAVVTYIGGRSWVKAAASKAEAIKVGIEGSKENPS